MQITSKTEDSFRIVSVEETRIDAAVAIAFKNAMRLETEGGPNVVILDLSNVQFIDSSGLGAIVASMKTMGADRTLALAGLTPTVEKVFRLTRMDSVFSVHHTLDDAIEKFGS